MTAILTKSNILQEYFLEDRVSLLSEPLYFEFYDYELGLCNLHDKYNIYIDLYKTGLKYENLCNSILAYLMGFTDQIPLDKVLTRGGIIPDIDTDFVSGKRELVFSYLKGKYGSAYVAGVATYGTMGARNAITNVGRALGYDLNLIRSISEAVPEPNQGKMYTIEESLEKSVLLKEMYNTNPDVKKIITISLKFEGLINSQGQHAAGVIISSTPISDVASCYYNDNDFPVVEMAKDDAEKLGLVKFDILGLETLDIIQSTLDLIKENRGIDVDIDNIDFYDPNLYAFIEKNAMCGVFQFDTQEFATYTSKFKPKHLEDISFLTSLNRPGPQSLKGAILKGRQEPSTIAPSPLHIPALDEILKPTYGYLIYQEQLMAASMIIANYTQADAVRLQKIVSKKKEAAFDKERENFIDKAVLNGYGRQFITDWWKSIEGFASYAFNKSHALGYSLLTLQCLYLKTYYYNEFFLSSLYSNIKTPENTFFFLKEARDFNMGITYPNINKCDYNCTIDKETNQIVLGLSFIKGFSEIKAQLLLKERKKNGPFTSFTDFYLRTVGGDVRLNKSHYESLIWLGAFQESGFNIPTLIGIYENIDNLFSRNLMYETIRNDNHYILELREDIGILEILTREYELTGLHISASLFDHIKATQGEKFGFIIKIKTTKTKKDGSLMCFASVLRADWATEDLTFFSKKYAQCQDILKKGNIISYKSFKEGIVSECSLKVSNKSVQSDISTIINNSETITLLNNSKPKKVAVVLDVFSVIFEFHKQETNEQENALFGSV